MRSTLYVPGDQPDKMSKALNSGADALILDLEDAVAPSSKDQARIAVCSFLAASSSEGPKLWAYEGVDCSRLESRVDAGLLTLDL